MIDLENLETKLNYTFNNRQLLAQALTHASAVDRAHHSYERMEFLGDRVLGFVIAQMLYHTFPRETEGDLAQRLAFLVSSPLLAEVASNLNLDQHVTSALVTHFSKVEKKESILADVCEALIAALYLDGGLDVTRRFVEAHWRPLLERNLKPPRDPKSELQEWLQEHSQTLPRYRLVEKKGPDHNPVFKVELTIDPFGTVVGQGYSVRKAEKEAAIEMLRRIETHG
jgi:ribonuclease III